MSSGTQPDSPVGAGTAIPHSAPDAGATNAPDPGPSAPEGFQAVRNEMVAEVARALGYAGVSPFEIEDWRIEDFADRLWRAGFRRVSVDDDTVERPADGDEGCLCHACGRRYRVDFDIPDALWQRIGMPPESGLLCGRCIAGRIEGLGEFDAFSLVPVIDGDTVERVARALYVCDDPRRIPGDAEAEWDDPDREDIRDAWRPLARAAVQALRDGPAPASNTPQRPALRDGSGT